MGREEREGRGEHSTVASYQSAVLKSACLQTKVMWKGKMTVSNSIKAFTKNMITISQSGSQCQGCAGLSTNLANIFYSFIVFLLYLYVLFNFHKNHRI